MSVLTFEEKLEDLADRMDAGDEFGGVSGVLREAAGAIRRLQAKLVAAGAVIDRAMPDKGADTQSGGADDAR